MDDGNGVYLTREEAALASWIFTQESILHELEYIVREHGREELDIDLTVLEGLRRKLNVL